MAPLSPAERSLRGRIGALRLHALHDTLVVSAPGRAAARAKLNARLLAEVDPDGSLSPLERERRLELARRAHYAGLALRSSRKRTARLVARQRDNRGNDQSDALATPPEAPR